MAVTEIRLEGFPMTVHVHYMPIRTMVLEINAGDTIVLKAPFGTSERELVKFVNESMNWLRGKTTHRPFVIEHAGIKIEVTYKAVRGLRMVAKNDGSVRLSAPFHYTKDEIRQFVVSQSKWLDVHVRQRIEAAPRPVEITEHPCEYGTEVRLFGKKRILRHKCEPVTPYLDVHDEEFVITGAEGISVDTRRKLLADWASRTFAEYTAAFVKHWLQAMQEPPLHQMSFKYLKSQWGNCRPDARKITLNTRLIYYPPEALESVVVHELCHLKERSHNKRFYALCTHYLPDYYERQQLLK